MDPTLSQDSLARLIPPPEESMPVTPDPPHATLPESAAAAFAKSQSSVQDNINNMTPPPSTQVPSSQRGKTRTPTPTVSHISTPPPTIEMLSQHNQSRMLGGFAGTMSAEQIANASVEELRNKITEIQPALQEAKMSAAHHKLQYQMLSQESAAAIERMSVEARMAQYENEVIHVAEQARAAATPSQPSHVQEGMVLVQKDLYQRMCREIQELTEERRYLREEVSFKDRMMSRQDSEIASLTDKVMLMRERIRENRTQLDRQRRSAQFDSTPRSTYNDPLRNGVSSHEQPQPFAALLQASEMASQEARRPTAAKKGHMRNTHSMSSLPTTPQRSQKQQPLYHTPYNRQPPLKVPSTAPVQRTSALRTPDVYAQNSLPVTRPPGPPSEGTVSAHEDDSEAETDIIDQDDQDEVSESQASRAASQMLRSSQEQQAKRESFSGRGMLGQSGSQGMKQTKLFGAVRKGGVERGGERPAKRARVEEAPVGLGIAGTHDLMTTTWVSSHQGRATVAREDFGTTSLDSFDQATRIPYTQRQPHEITLTTDPSTPCSFVSSSAER
ncbi:uncharacterized protein LTR77_005588 [Saxophila tyrrhenica]|uniref:Uncharacterized protein n=1 Tax=Saxophila tyrrhenica TaxID=1690608 RepID=A0AAV9PB55_9PEZI|nr:hypothetical protein LTR77_005588 [Saxophila tyrrhenica]